MRYRKHPWKDVVDPAFSGFIEFILDLMRRQHIPSNEGFLSLELDEEELTKMEREGFPGIAFMYEKPESVYGIMGDIGLLLGREMSKTDVDAVARKVKSRTELYEHYLSAAKSFENGSRDYYVKSFDFLSSEEKYKAYFVEADEGEVKREERSTLAMG